MKIGILTQPLGYNYGGILQNYALQEVLKSLGHSPQTIDFGFRYSKQRYILSLLLSFVCNCLGIKRPYPPKPYKGKNIPSLTGRFITKHLFTTKPFDSCKWKSIRKYHFGAVIVGSDQVWRPAYNSYCSSIEDMFLPYEKGLGKKIAYAASFGTSQWEYNDEQTQSCKTLIKDFDAVSVREESGVLLLKKHLDYPYAQSVLDPTLLLPKEKYESLCRSVPCDTTKYVCAYVLDITDEKRELVSAVAKEKRLDIKFFSAHDNLNLSVEQWLSSFRDASFVITDSFHGTVFSIIFEREFLVIPNAERGTDRFISLLSAINLTDRIYNPESGMPATINWANVKNRLSLLQDISLNFLKTSL